MLTTLLAVLTTLLAVLSTLLAVLSTTLVLYLSLIKLLHVYVYQSAHPLSHKHPCALHPLLRHTSIAYTVVSILVGLQNERLHLAGIQVS